MRGVRLCKMCSVNTACQGLTGCASDGIPFTHAGPQEELSPLCAKLKDEGVFVRELDTLGIAYHSPALNPFCDKLRRALSAVVPHPKERSKRWLSTCFPLDSDEAGSRTCGPDYHVRPLSLPRMLACRL